jgi:hypothetical protein
VKEANRLVGELRVSHDILNASRGVKNIIVSCTAMLSFV